MAVLLSVIGSVSAQISFLVDETSHLLRDATMDDLKELQVILQPVISTLEDEKMGSILRNSQSGMVELKELVYEMDDVVGLFVYEMLRSEVLARNPLSLAGQTHKLIHEQGLNSHLFLHELVIRLKSVREWFRPFRQVNDGVVRPLFTTHIPSTSSWYLSPSVVGREKEKEQIVNQLLQNGSNNSDDSGDMTRILQIAGSRGLGKTTVAQLVYNDHRIVEKFDLRGWVNVWENFDVTTATKKILESFSHVKCDLVELSRLQDSLMLLLRGKAFLLVMDDVWNHDPSLWRTFLDPFVDAQSGSIIVTTWVSGVAIMKATVSSFYLRSLCSEDSWVLFRKTAFGSRDIKGLDELLDIGKAITAKLRGAPLAIKLIASALRQDLNEVLWSEVSNRIYGHGHDGYKVYDRYDGCGVPLRLSYDLMPVNMKECFLFFSLYPKGHIFFKDDQIRLWLFAGLLHGGPQEPQSIGSLLFDQLVERSMIEPYLVDEGRSGGFYIHDSVHAFAVECAKEDFSRVTRERDVYNLSSKVRYLSLYVPHCLEFVNCFQLRGLRFLKIEFPVSKLNHVGVTINILEKLFDGFNLLRSLILRDNLIEALPDSVGDLKLLCYLDLANTGIESLPDSICNLYNLRILDLTNCPIQKLPSGIVNLVRLEQLIFQQSLSVYVPHGIGKLTRLRTLSMFNVKRGSWHCALSELKDLVNLRGELYIAGLSNVASLEEGYDANLGDKRNLDVLILDWSRGPYGSHYIEQAERSHDSSSEQGLIVNPEFHAELFDSLRPTEYLKELHIHEFCGSRFPNWLGDSSFNMLLEISIKHGKISCGLLPSLGQLPSLKNLMIESTEGVHEVRREFCSLDKDKKGFLSLKTLSFSDMKNWNCWVEVESGDFCSLRTLRIADCPELKLLPDPLSTSLTKLVIKDCDKLAKIPTLPSLSFLILSGQIKEGLFAFTDLPMLKALKISDSRNTRSLDVARVKFRSLEVLVIHKCRNLKFIAGLDNLISLKTIKISACQSVQFSLKQKFPSTLERLDILNCPLLKKWRKARETIYYDLLNKKCDASDEVLQELELTEFDLEDDDSE